MRLRFLVPAVLAATLMPLAAGAQQPPAPPAPPAPPEAPARHARAAVYQGGRHSGAEQTDRFSRKVKLGRQGWVGIGNISGDIVVSAGSGDEVTIEAVKSTRGDRAQLDSVKIVVDERPGRVEVRTDHTGRNDRVSVDYTVTVPADASVELHSVSGDVKVTGVQGNVRAESVSGDITAAKTPRLERAKSVSGDVDLSDAGSDAEISAGSVSGSVRAKGLKARSLDLQTVSGDVTLAGVTAERVGIKSVSGTIEYDGPLVKSGRYEMNSHSGTVRLMLGTGTGFELNASSFSGSIRSDLPLTVGGPGQASEATDRGRHRGGMGQTMRATYGDGSAMLTVRTFSGDVVIVKK